MGSVKVKDSPESYFLLLYIFSIYCPSAKYDEKRTLDKIEALRTNLERVNFRNIIFLRLLGGIFSTLVQRANKERTAQSNLSI